MCPKILTKKYIYSTELGDSESIVTGKVAGWSRFCMISSGKDTLAAMNEVRLFTTHKESSNEIYKIHIDNYVSAGTPLISCLWYDAINCRCGQTTYKDATAHGNPRSFSEPLEQSRV